MRKLESITSRLIEGIIQSAESNGIPINGGSVSAMFEFFLCEGPVRNFEEAKTNDSELFASCIGICSSVEFTLHQVHLRQVLHL